MPTATIAPIEIASKFGPSGKIAIALIVVKPPARPVEKKARRDSVLNHLCPAKKPTKSAPRMLTIQSATSVELTSAIANRKSEPSAPPLKVSSTALRDNFCEAIELLLRRVFATRTQVES